MTRLKIKILKTLTFLSMFLSFPLLNIYSLFISMLGYCGLQKKSIKLLKIMSTIYFMEAVVFGLYLIETLSEIIASIFISKSHESDINNVSMKDIGNLCYFLIQTIISGYLSLGFYKLYKIDIICDAYLNDYNESDSTLPAYSPENILPPYSPPATNINSENNQNNILPDPPNYDALPDNTNDITNNNPFMTYPSTNGQVTSYTNTITQTNNLAPINNYNPFLNSPPTTDIPYPYPPPNNTVILTRNTITSYVPSDDASIIIMPTKEIPYPPIAENNSGNLIPQTVNSTNKQNNTVDITSSYNISNINMNLSNSSIDNISNILPNNTQLTSISSVDISTLACTTNILPTALDTNIPINTQNNDSNNESNNDNNNSNINDNNVNNDNNDSNSDNSNNQENSNCNDNHDSSNNSNNDNINSNDNTNNNVNSNGNTNNNVDSNGNTNNNVDSNGNTNNNVDSNDNTNNNVNSNGNTNNNVNSNGNTDNNINNIDDDIESRPPPPYSLY